MMKSDDNFPCQCSIAAIVVIRANFPVIQLSVSISTQTQFYDYVIAEFNWAM